MLFRTIALVAGLAGLLPVTSCLKKNNSQNEVKGRTKTQYHAVATIRRAEFAISDSWAKSVYKWIENRPDKQVPYTDPGFAKDLGWILSRSIKFSFAQLRAVGATSAPEISTYRTKCEVLPKPKGDDLTKLLCDTSFDVYWNFERPLVPNFDVWIPHTRSQKVDDQVFATFSKTCGQGDGFTSDEFYLHFDINKPGCTAKQSPLFSKISLQLAEGEKTNRQGIPDYQSAWSDQKLVGLYAFGRDNPLTDATKKVVRTHFEDFLSNQKNEAYKKPFYSTLENADRSFIETVERFIATQSIGPVVSHQFSDSGHSLVFMLVSKTADRAVESTFVLGSQDNLLGDANNRFLGSELAPSLAAVEKHADFVFYGGHSTGGSIESLFKKTLTQIPAHAIVMVFGCETTSFVNHHLAYDERPLAQKPVIFANLGFPNFTEFPGELSFLIRRYAAYPTVTSSWNEILGVVPMGSLMHETK